MNYLLGKTFFLTVFFMLFLQSSLGLAGTGEQKASASQSEVTSTKETCKSKVQAKVNGLVCDFCARSLEKVFLKKSEVSQIKVDLKAGVVDISMKEGKTLDDTTIKTLFADAGYDLKTLTKGGCDGA
ncbi:MAG: heavy metal-associated domain-containing protein [Proteobacteria bacterium]|nr:heavy metal-associated domain-containing protein [Pseudomonadota bacterium]